MHVIGYLASLLIGLSLGMIGGGGSILTMPVLVYLFGLSPVTATSYSLFVVGLTSLAGVARQYRLRTVRLRLGLLFAAVSMITVFIIRRWVTPLIPERIGHVFGLTIRQSWLTMVLFALLMILSSLSMLRKVERDNIPEERERGNGQWLLYGCGVGIVTGLLGAGGGFLLIPAFVLLARMPMKEAVGTSLFVIALNSLTGFATGIAVGRIDWPLLLSITVLAVAGILLGSYISRRLSGGRLRTAFGWFVMTIGMLILVKEMAGI